MTGYSAVVTHYQERALADLTSPPSPQSPDRRNLPAAERSSITEYLAFRLGEETYAVPLTAVREILSIPTLTWVPRAPAEVMGIISVRGLLVTVIDPRRKLLLPSLESKSKRARILLMPNPAGEVMGMYVDEVLHVYRLAEAEIESAQAVLGGNLSDYVQAIARRDDTMLILLSLSTLVTY